MADTKRSPNFLDKTKANNARIVAMIEAKKGPVGKGHHNSHRTAAIMTWLNSQEAKKGSSTPKPNDPNGGVVPDNPNVDSNPNDWTPKKSSNHGVSPKGTPDINLSRDKMSATTPEKTPIVGRKQANKSDGLTPNMHLPAPRALSPEETKYYQYLRQHLNDPGGVDKLNNFLATVHDSNA